MTVYVTAAPTYTQLDPRGGAGSNTHPAPATAYPPQSTVWPQWQQATSSDQAPPPASSSSTSSTQRPTPAQTQQQPSAGQSSASQQQAPPTSTAPPGSGGGQQSEEFSDMLRMLDNSGTEFSDLSGMFNTFTE